jgi:hypothetical protein
MSNGERLTAAQSEPMAIIKWDFVMPHNGIHYKGESTCRELKTAQGVLRTMIELYGVGTHWVEAQNMTWEEHIEAGRRALEDGK